jgi:hypothetical protein
MIASPSDVPEERRIAREAILEWNSINSRDRGIVLMPIGWESHSSPDTGDRPQALINGQILKHADLLIAIFWTRLGTSTGVAPSGTVEEIEEHIKAGKPAMIYFSSAPVVLDSVDQEQSASLKVFKKSLQDRGLYEQFGSTAEFSTKFSRQLALKVIEKFLDGKRPSRGLDEVLTQPHREGLGLKMILLLKEAVRDPQGVILYLREMSGLSIQTNGRTLFDRGDARAEALWTGAVRDLLGQGFIVDMNGKGEVFKLTDKGYFEGDALQVYGTS